MEPIENANSELIRLLENLTQENEKQRELLSRQYRVTRRLALMLLCLTASVVIFLFTLLPRLNATLKELNVVVVNTQEITEDLKAADLAGTVRSLENTLQSVDGLIGASSDSLEATLQKMQAIDIDSLNDAINDLARVVRPLASLFPN